MKKASLFGACAAAGLASFAWSDAAWAQSAAQTETVAEQPIVVTAARRAQNLQDVPGAVTAFNTQTIDDLRLTNAIDFTQLLPNAIFEEGNFNINASISIRGVRPGQDISEPGFGYYRNGHYMGGLRTNFSDLVDLERVEVLRGPQGGLYGRNAVGGAVNFIYARPDLDAVGGMIQGGYGSYDRVEARGVFNAPITEGVLAARFSGWFIDQTEGQFRNVTLGEDIDTYSSSGARIGVRWRPSSAFDATWQVERSNQLGPEVIGVQPGLGETERTIVADTQSEADKTFTFASQNLDWTTDLGVFSLLASYRDYKLESVGDQDGGAVATNQQVIRRYEDADAFYLEGQWVSPEDQPLTWVAGVDVFTETFNLVRPVTCAGSACTFSRSQTSFEVVTDSVAAFGEATLSVTDTLDLIASGRYNRDTKELDFLRLVYNPAGAETSRIPARDDATFENTSFGAGVQWRPTANVNLYARYNEGFRAGGYNTGITGANFELSRLPFDEETSQNIEFGAKTTWLNGRVTANLAIFRLKQDDLQAFQPDAFGQFFVDNLGEAETDGVEFEFGLFPTARIDITGGIGWLDGELTGGRDFSGPLAGKGILFGSGMNWNLNAVYRHPVQDALDLVVQASWRANEPEFDGVPLFFVGDLNTFQTYSLVNASVALEAEQWRLRAFATNLTDEQYIVAQAFFNPFGPGTLNTLNPDRRFGVELSFDF
ncbi:MAG: TonB-dependent receptor [Hyphomonadaceae bacterium]|nr:TonB-dependent receptor [Hyphomonadaceae bacterium]